ncbi:MAG: ATP-grasp domain-containing protein [Bacteroidota bacterium]
MENKIRTVAVSGLHRGENPQPGASVIASLRRRFPGIRVVGLSYDPLESSLYGQSGDHPDSAYLIPYPGAGSDALFSRLQAILEKEDIGLIIPCLDSEIENYVEIKDRLTDHGVACVLPSIESFNLRHKANLHLFCQSLGVYSPRTLVAMTPAEIELHARELGYPVYIKGRLYEAHLVDSPSELEGAYADMVRIWGWPVMVQEVIVGEEYDITGIGDGHGNIVNSCSIRKLLRTSNGKGYGGIVVDNHELDALAAKIISGLEWNGPFELEFLKASNKPYGLFEINPRFPAWIDFPSQIGCNLPAMLLERCLGLPVNSGGRCPAGRMFIRHSVDLVGDFSDFVAMAAKGERFLSPTTRFIEASNDAKI